MKRAAGWIEHYRKFWEGSLDNLASYPGVGGFRKNKTNILEEEKGTEIMSTTTTAEALVVSRLIAAPRERVFKAWTTPEIAQWICPTQERKVLAAKVDLRVGGAYHLRIAVADGKEHPFDGVYREIKPPEKVVFTWSLGDCFPEFKGHESLVTVDLKEEKGGTRVTITHEGLPTAEMPRPAWRGLDGFVREFGPGGRIDAALIPAGASPLGERQEMRGILTELRN